MVKVINIDPSGKIRLSRKALIEPPEGGVPPAGEGGPREGGERPRREGGRGSLPYAVRFRRLRSGVELGAVAAAEQQRDQQQTPHRSNRAGEAGRRCSVIDGRATGRARIGGQGALGRHDSAYRCMPFFRA